MDLAIADAHYALGDHPGAHEAAGRAQSSGGVADRVRANNIVGKIAFAQARYSDAAELFLANEEEAKRAQLEHLALQARVNRGLAHFHLRQYDEARAIFEKALKQTRAASDIAYEALSLVNLGVICQRTSEIGLCIRYFQGAMALFSRMGQLSALRLAAWNLANVYTALGMGEMARGFLEESRRISDEIDSDRGRAFVHFTDGDLAYDRAEYAAALAAYENARGLFEKVGDKSRVDEMSTKAGWAALRLGDLEAVYARLDSLDDTDVDTVRGARRDALEGATLVVEGDAHGDTASATANRGAALLARAVKTFANESADEDAWRTGLHLAQIYKKIGDANSAAAAQKAAADLLRGFSEKLTGDLQTNFKQHIRRTYRFDLDTGEDALPVDERGQTLAPERAPAPSQRSPVWDERYPEIIGSSSAILRVFDRLDRIARMRQHTVLIRGESGTGKELVAAAAHRMSQRRQGPFVRVNCAALVETLLMSELFGHEKGSFTGAFARKIGRFEMARGGTIFLDEIGDISPKTQVSLLRVLQERTFERVGGTQTLETDAEVFCATHRDLEQMVREGSFREDLYYRLRGVVVEVPALRDRPEDIPELARHFLRGARDELGRAPSQLSAAAQEVLIGYTWPGNIRELQNVVRSVALFCEGDVVQPSHLAEFPELFQDRAAPRPQMIVRPREPVPAVGDNVPIDHPPSDLPAHTPRSDESPERLPLARRSLGIGARRYEKAPRVRRDREGDEANPWKYYESGRALEDEATAIEPDR